MIRYFVGLDLGQKVDYSAIAVVERCLEDTGEFDFGTYERVSTIRYLLRHLERPRLGTPYPEVVRRLRDLTQELGPERCVLVADATGVGGPVMDLLREAKLGCTIVPVTLTGGDRQSTEGGSWRVPKRDLMVGLETILERGELKIAGRLREAAALKDELLRVRMEVTASGHDRYGADRHGEHDDLVIAVALACWRARLKPVGEQQRRLL